LKIALRLVTFCSFTNGCILTLPKDKGTRKSNFVSLRVLCG